MVQLAARPAAASTAMAADAAVLPMLDLRAAAAELSHNPAMNARPTTLLIVEDNEMNLEALSRLLMRRGFQVTGVGTGEEALRIATAGRPDLILMDIGLPGIDGYETTRRLKADAATAAIPVIALTAHALVTDRERAFQAGCVEFDTKPIDLARLCAKITACLER